MADKHALLHRRKRTHCVSRRYATTTGNLHLSTKWAFRTDLGSDLAAFHTDSGQNSFGLTWLLEKLADKIALSLIWDWVMRLFGSGIGSERFLDLSLIG